MKSVELRQAFLDYFARHGHEVVASSPLIPANDPSLLFTNAGMVQFKDVFLGNEKRPYHRAASSQRCVRAGGKHNDLENVGYTARHHTFFEMLGNFSFGDYFKREAIGYAWEFLTVELAIPAERLWVTVFEEDDEAADIWLKEVGVDASRFSRIGATDNFWSMGDTGPCGPCSEIFYDHGPGVAGGPPGTPDADGDRYIEIWNLVFMQYDRAADGRLTPLPKPSVDTGMGLERLAAVMQGVHSNYEIDLFRHLIEAAARVTGCENHDEKSLRVIADHIRSTAFLITDGVIPSNEGRGYVLRRIIRRAIRHGYMLGAESPFFYRLVDPLVREMGAAYPELAATRDKVEAALKQEEERFAETIDTGMRILDQALAQLEGDTLDGATCFKLYDTYGFPLDLTADIARERGLVVDTAGFEHEMEQQRTRARSASQFSGVESARVDVEGETQFTGYQHLDDNARVLAILHDNETVERLDSGQEAVLVLDRTPFYAESGGQAGDRGRIVSRDAVFEIRDTQKLAGNVFGHIGVLRMGSLAANDPVRAEVDTAARRATALNHSATHLMHAALKQVLGKHVEQKGSLVTDRYLRFDFSHFSAMTDGELQAVQALVNDEIRANRAVDTELMSLDAAREAGAVALFGEKYGDTVRVVSMGEFSMELCGGTHVDRTGDIGLFVIRSEGGVAAGVRRIEALTGQGAMDYLTGQGESLKRIAAQLRATPDKAEEKVSSLLERIRELERQVSQLNDKLASAAGGDLADTAVEVQGIPVIATRAANADSDSMRKTIDQLRSRLGSAVVVLGAESDGKVTFIAGITADLTDRLHAGKLVKSVAELAGGRGGGRPDMAQAGASQPEKLDEALAAVTALIEQQLAS